MKLLSSRPAMWSLFLFNLAVAVAAALFLDGPTGLATAVCMGAVSLVAGSALLLRQGQRA
ncbi:hypothetical protein [Pengzhenrongella sp.]|jgi:hypothetical protein|uniref:hypothetical protein n=1 Tax=Pengzhenrongella sp. TaxID=2888820 RepID=UPI002F929DB7